MDYYDDNAYGGYCEGCCWDGSNPSCLNPVCQQVQAIARAAQKQADDNMRAARANDLKNKYEIKGVSNKERKKEKKEKKKDKKKK